MKKIILSLYLLTMAATLSAQTFIPIWEKGKMPNSRGLNLPDSIANERIYQVGHAGLYLFETSQAENKGAAVVIVPRRRLCPAGLPKQRLPACQMVQHDGIHRLRAATPAAAVARCRDLLPGSSARHATRLALHTRPRRPLGHRPATHRRHGLIGRAHTCRPAPPPLPTIGAAQATRSTRYRSVPTSPYSCRPSCRWTR